MKNIQFLLTVFIFCLASCKEQGKPDNTSTAFIDTTKVFKKEFPKSENGDFDLFYKLTKVKQNQLGLDSLENGYDNLQIRVWYDSSRARGRERKLIVITNNDTNWTAKIYTMQLVWNGETETIASKKVRQITPKSRWSIFSKKLLELKILTLPNMEDIPGLIDNWKDGETYHIEVATKMQYRFYSYHLPNKFQTEFWQAKNMTEILSLFSTELRL